MPKTPNIKVKINCENLDEAIEKANRLVELLREAKQIIDSLGSKSNVDIDDVVNAFCEKIKGSLHCATITEHDSAPCDSNHTYNHKGKGSAPSLVEN